MYKELTHLIRELRASELLRTEVHIKARIGERPKRAKEGGDTCAKCVYKGACEDDIYLICIEEIDESEYFV